MMTDTWTWATVTQASPLRIKVDGDTSALDATTDNLVGSLAVSDRVRVHLHADGIIVTGIQGGGNRSNPNLLYNSTFMVNQQGYGTGGYVNAGDYGFDGWKATTTSRMYFSPQAQTVQVAIIGSFAQVVERSKIWPDDPHTLSWTGDAQARVFNSGGTAPAYASSPITVTLDGAADVLVEFDDGTLKWPKFERGAIATPYALPNYADDLRECMRYFQVILDFSAGAYYPASYFTSAEVYAFIPLPVKMRATPTIVATTGTNYYVVLRDSGLDYFTTFENGGSNTTQVSLKNNTEAAGTGGQAGQLKAFSSGARVTADARL